MDFCQRTASIWKYVGQILFILKIVIPVAIIVLASIDLGKAVISGDEKAIKSSTSTLIKRFIAGVFIFFVPTIINAAFSLVADFNTEIKDNYKNCFSCVSNPYKDDCDTSYKGEFFTK